MPGSADEVYSSADFYGDNPCSLSRVNDKADVFSVAKLCNLFNREPLTRYITCGSADDKLCIGADKFFKGAESFFVIGKDMGY